MSKNKKRFSPKEIHRINVRKRKRQLHKTLVRLQKYEEVSEGAKNLAVTLRQELSCIGE